MGASMFSGKIVLILFALSLGFGFSMGFLHWDKSKERCMVSRNWQEGSWHTFWAVGRLEFRVRDFGCDPAFRLDPAKWEEHSGTVSPR